MQDLFFTEVRRRGEFTRRRGFREFGEAFAFGREVAGETAAVSFRVTDPKGKVVEDATLLDILGGGKFRRSKKEAGVFIERRAERISSAGEIFEIPGEAKRQRKSKGFRGFL